MISISDSAAAFRAAALALVLAGCAQGDGKVPAADSDAGSRGEPASLAESPEWSGETTGGTPLTVRPDPAPVRPGPLTLEVVLARDPGRTLPLSVDVASSQMPMHGIRRYMAEALSTTRYRVETEIPMEGLWSLYVNLDAGTDVAGFELDVPPGEEGGAHQHGGQGMEPGEDPAGSETEGTASPGDQGSHSSHTQHPSRR